ncbi:hypothetical protein EJ04DRAFT_582063 [Polyplosphaeria fusca]|uniref:Rhodopsin domain-containing protein n=1 Tax=Polyplosphaeria fusca TaxID=682080 RepID=A0A9P4QKY3_9PLEO|nr:hypothetical protein EJ04DRAFT_582063 [Polyplosphaeria fusca]
MAFEVSHRGAQVIAWSHVMWVIALVFVILRLVVRAKVVHVVGREDVCIFFALLASIATCVFMHLQVSKGGLGTHMADISDDHLIEFSKYVYLSILFYNTSLCLTKFALIFLCIRVFGPSTWRFACYAVLTFVSVYTFWAIANSIVPCYPIERYWDKSVAGWCFPNAVLWFVNASLNIFTDLLVVVLPIPGIIRLQLPRKQKIGVSLVFALGFFVCIISIVRLYALQIGSYTKDPTYDNFAIAIWSVVEVNAAIVGACLPTLKPLITRVWPRLLSSGLSGPRSRPSYFPGTGPVTIGSQRGPNHFAADSESATEILADEGVVLSNMDRKITNIHTGRMDDEGSDRAGSRTQWRESSDEEERAGYVLSADRKP